MACDQRLDESDRHCWRIHGNEDPSVECCHCFHSCLLQLKRFAVGRQPTVNSNMKGSTLGLISARTIRFVKFLDELAKLLHRSVHRQVAFCNL